MHRDNHFTGAARMFLAVLCRKYPKPSKSWQRIVRIRPVMSVLPDPSFRYLLRKQTLCPMDIHDELLNARFRPATCTHHAEAFQELKLKNNEWYLLPSVIIRETVMTAPAYVPI